ncbi:MAG TPA: class I SAM-dependent methyltransferase [Opitutaceae bacterium]|nr:class I SAM-dependent methyltransferase [Opitutaceae bacterium]
MTSDARFCFDQLARDDRWQTFTAEERRTLHAFVRRWRIRPGDHVLEPGCGSGRLTEVLAALVGSTGRVVAFDISAAFMRLAGRRRLPPQVTLHSSAMEALPLESGSFDHVICFNVFPHLFPHATTARRLAAALRPGGVFWIAHTCSRAFVNGVHRHGPPALHEHLLPPPRDLARLLRKAGLDEVEVEDGADRFLARAVRCAPTAAPLKSTRHV